MTLRLYFDEDSAWQSLVRQLRARGADLATAYDVGMAGKTDDEQLQWAARNSRVVYSFNRGHFYALHTAWLHQGRSHCGIVLSKQGLSVGEQMRRLMRLMNRLSAEEMRDRVEFLSVWG